MTNTTKNIGSKQIYDQQIAEAAEASKQSSEQADNKSTANALPPFSGTNDEVIKAAERYALYVLGRGAGLGSMRAQAVINDFLAGASLISGVDYRKQPELFS